MLLKTPEAALGRRADSAPPGPPFPRRIQFTVATDTLWQEHRTRIDVPVIAIAALVLWGVGLTSPLVATEKLIGSDSAYSVLSGLWELAQSTYFYLAVPLFLFSVVLPGAKLLLLFYTWFLPMAAPRRGLFYREEVRFF